MSDRHGTENPAVLDHFINARNIGDVANADGVGEVGAVSCGDVVRLSIRVHEGRILEARFRAYGCGTVIACGSAATELLRGRTLDEAARFSNEELSTALGGLPATKAHCPVLVEEAVKTALADYRQRHR